MLDSIPNIVLVALAGSVLYYLGVVLYRLTLHPLAKYPGPLLAKITSWYDVYHCYKQDRHVDQYECQQKYGNTFRYGPNYLVVNTAEGLKDIYTNAKMHNLQKGQMYKFLREYGNVSTHSAIDKNVHAFKRRVLNHAFSEAALRNLEPLMIETIDKWLVALGSGESTETKRWSSPKDMATWANYVTFDVLGNLCFGKPFGLLDSEDLEGIPSLMLVRGKLLQVVGNSPLRAAYKFMQEKTPLEKYLSPSAHNTLGRFKAFAMQALKDRFAMIADIEKSGDKPRKDFVHYLSQARDPITGQGYAQAEMLIELRLLIIAGSDTSSVVMAAAFFYLARNPDVLKKLQGELRSTFTDVNQIVTGQELASCRYLRAVIDETLRLAPPVPSSIPRTIMNGGMTVGNHPLPAGITVGSGAFAIHRSSEYFSEPLTFKPERWLSEYTPKGQLEHARSAFCPYSLGIRGCIGKPMAYNEMSVALGRVFWMYDIRLTPGDETGKDKDGLYTTGDVFISERHGPKIEFRKAVQA